jgi:hypothetical protein
MPAQAGIQKHLAHLVKTKAICSRLVDLNQFI